MSTETKLDACFDFVRALVAVPFLLVRSILGSLLLTNLDLFTFVCGGQNRFLTEPHHWKALREAGQRIDFERTFASWLATSEELVNRNEELEKQLASKEPQ